MSAKCFKPLYGFCTQLLHDVARDDTAITLSPKHHAKISQELNSRYYSYLVLTDGLCHEIVNVELLGGLLVVCRQRDKTEAYSWPCGTAVRYDSVPSAIYDMTQMCVDIPKAECEEPLFTGEICSGNVIVHFKDGVATHETCNKNHIADGCYDHPVVTYRDGKLVAIGEGSNRIHHHILGRGCR